MYQTKPSLEPWYQFKFGAVKLKQLENYHSISNIAYKCKVVAFLHGQKMLTIMYFNVLVMNFSGKKNKKKKKSLPSAGEY